MPAISTKLQEFITLAYRLNDIAYSENYDCHQGLSALNAWCMGKIATQTAVMASTPRAPRTRIGNAQALTKNQLLTKNQAAMLSYAQQHPTVVLTIPLLKGVSPFKHWEHPERLIGVIGSGLVKKGYFSGDSTTGWSLANSNIDRTLTRSTAPRTRRTRTARTARVSGNGQQQAAQQAAATG